MIAELLGLLQAKRSTPVPYRPKLLGLVERFHRTWKDMGSLYINEEQDDWDEFLPCVMYAYNGSEHAAHGHQPNKQTLDMEPHSELVSWCGTEIYKNKIQFIGLQVDQVSQSSDIAGEDQGR
ncbi:unnamed protein product [Phytophthora fragariaefolia]|uniref:Unnamed protein product n=1 Tax=Phytophthora fragariaefolia TaxID=1490495 RepID=A0A9W7D1U8_9STRA|nr:unnamed protein product [Phytophthora fragariaefolia]